MRTKRTHRAVALFRSFAHRVRANKLSFFIYVLLGTGTLTVAVLTLIDGQYESTFTAVLSLLLLLLPTFVEESFRIKLPIALETVALLFVFCANILGEIFAFYTYVPFWDDLLHCTSGFIFAAFGFSLAELLNRNGKFDFHISPIFVSTVALCFAVTVGVVWELFEFGADLLLHTDMQRDTVISGIYSAYLNPEGQAPVGFDAISETAVYASTGEVLRIRGYLDVGLVDTMKDLLIDLIGALLFCVIGYFYTGHSSRAQIARQFIPRVRESDGGSQEKE